MAVALVSACGGGSRDRAPGGNETVFRPSPDSGVVLDASAAPDAGPGTDGGRVADAGGIPDAGAPDAGGDPPPTGAFLYVGAGGGGPGTDLHISSVEAVYAAASIPVAVGESIPGDFATRFGLLALMNPQDGVPVAVVDAARDLLARGGRVLVVMEHCKNGCWGNASGDSDFIRALGGSITLSGEGGAPLAQTSLALTSVPGITDGVSELVVYYSGSVDPGQGVALGQVPDGDPVIAYEAVGGGEIVVVADSSMFGFVIEAGDNQTFIANLARF